MKKFGLMLLVTTIALFVAAQGKPKKSAKCSTSYTDDCDKETSAKLVCRLTSPELKQRKETVITSLKKQILAKKELTNGYSYKFAGTDKMVDELIEFIKTERECCNFFVFNLLINGDKSVTVLEIKGPQRAKEFIKTELGM
jgi:hypothetical protein